MFEQLLVQDELKSTCVVVAAFQLFECLLREEQHKQWTKIQIRVCDNEWQDHAGITHK